MGASGVDNHLQCYLARSVLSATQPGASRLLCTHGTAAVAATGPARSVSGGSHTPDPRHVRRFSTCTAIGHLPGSPDLHGTKGIVRSAVPQRDVRGGTRWYDMFSASTPLKTTALFSRWQLWRRFPSREGARTPRCSSACGPRTDGIECGGTQPLRTRVGEQPLRLRVGRLLLGSTCPPLGRGDC